MGRNEGSRRRERAGRAGEGHAQASSKAGAEAVDVGQTGDQMLILASRLERRETDYSVGSLAVRQERAFALLCQGWRVAAIARALGVSPTTVRRWVRKRVDDLSRDAREAHATVLLRAIESQREIAREAWEAYENERAIEAAVLRGDFDRIRRRAVRRTGRRDDSGDNSGGDGEAEQVLLEEYERPRHTSQGARYLGIALAAQREIARLYGLYEDIAPEPGEIKITISRRPDGPLGLPSGARQQTAGLATDGGEGCDDDEERSPESQRESEAGT